MTVFYTKSYQVSFLRHLLSEWIRYDRFYDLRGYIVDAIEGHSENDCVRVRLPEFGQIEVFETVAAEMEATDER